MKELELIKALNMAMTFADERVKTSIKDIIITVAVGMTQVKEAVKKKRAPSQKLTEDDVKTIIGLLHSGCKMVDIARRFKCNATNIEKIAHGYTWRDIPRPQGFPYKQVVKKARFSGYITSVGA